MTLTVILQSVTAEIKQLREELINKDKLIKTLECRIDILEQNNIKNNIEITKRTQNENLMQIFTKIAKNLIINNISEKDVSNIYLTCSHNHHKYTIIMSLAQYSKKLEFLVKYYRSALISLSCY